MRAAVLERVRELNIREIDIDENLGENDVEIDIDTVGVCGSDVHFYTHGRIGPFVVKAPMILGHEAAGVVKKIGTNVSCLSIGDRVCMEPGIPDPNAKAVRLGMYNVDPAVRFWATPPIHGCLRPSVTHPAAFTFRLPNSVSFAEGAMVEPFAIGMQAASRTRIRPGDVAAVVGAGPIGIMVALAALAGGCSKVFISDVKRQKLEIASNYANIVPVDVNRERLSDVIAGATGGWGVDVAFEASGNPNVYDELFAVTRPGGAVTLVGMPVEPISFDIVAVQAKELSIETVFRYANVFDRALGLIASGAVDLNPLITETFSFEDTVAAFERAADGLPADVKLQIKL